MTYESHLLAGNNDLKNLFDCQESQFSSHQFKVIISAAHAYTFSNPRTFQLKRSRSIDFAYFSWAINIIAGIITFTTVTENIFA